MKIASVVCAYPPYKGGMGNAAARQAAMLRDAGHEVVVMCPALEGKPRVDRVDGIEVRRLRPWLRQRVSAFVPSLAGQLRGFDALYLHYPFFGGAEAATLGAARHGIPTLAYFHMDVQQTGLRGAVIRAYELMLAGPILRAAKRVFVSSIDYAQQASIHSLQLSTLQELPYGIDTDEFRPGPVDAELLRSLDIDPLRPIVLFVGGMDAGHVFKGVPVLIQAMARLGETPAQLVLVGDGELRAGFQALAAESCRADVRFVGAAPNATLRQLYRAARVTVLPSTSTEEAFGLVLIESLASGTPVIASDLPGVRRVPDAGTGRCVPVGDVERLCEAIRPFADGDPATLAMRDAARVRAVERFSRERERRDLLEAFAGLVPPR